MLGSGMGNLIPKRPSVKAIAASKAAKLRDGGGLWLTTKGKGRYWIFDYRFGGKRREMGIGPLHTVGLAEARQRAERARELVRRGIDPIENRAVEAIEAAKASDDVVMFGQYADAYIDEAVKAGRWRGSRTEPGWRNTLTNHCATIRGKPIAEIDISDVLSVVRPLWGTKQETAEKLRWRIEQILDAARVKVRSGDNPARWKGHLGSSFTSPTSPRAGITQRYRIRTRQPLCRGFAAWTQSQQGRWNFRDCHRSGETRLAVFTEFDLDGALWNIGVPHHELF